MATDRVSLTVPARGEYAKTARMTAAELASRLGMSYDDVDDVRMAAEEAFVYASARLADDGVVSFTFTVEPDSLTINVGPLPVSSEEHDADGEAQDRYAAFILESVCDTFHIHRESGTCTLSLVKRATFAGE
ncbi:MAG: ATP-binding protein [Coriobacteriia bacterium]